MNNLETMKKYVAEFIGTFWLVFGGCGSAIFAAAFPELGIGFAGVALAFGLTVLTMAYAIGAVSGCHLNPAVTIGLRIAGRMPSKDVIPYIIAQIIGGIAGAAIIYLIATGKPGFEVGGFAANGYDEHSPGGYNIISAFVAELVLTFVFLLVILGSTDEKSNGKFAGLAIGLALTLIHLISIPITNTSVNPARSLSQAVFAEGVWALEQLWLFWVAPILGAVLAALVYSFIYSKKETTIVS
ncbi:aquaporin Z [Flavobacterium sp. ASW18X]|uniref:aquaporin Z n=1 Tax=Flavobacterium sp. ASW18X TaxID=2572595 RepID=UPI0021021D10|nr:aquaporin Z [Flavobacterium sp. ASW18X]